MNRRLRYSFLANCSKYVVERVDNIFFWKENRIYFSIDLVLTFSSPNFQSDAFGASESPNSKQNPKTEGKSIETLSSFDSSICFQKQVYCPRKTCDCKNLEPTTIET